MKSKDKTMIHTSSQPSTRTPLLPAGLPDIRPGFQAIYDLLGITKEEVKNDHSEAMEAFRRYWRSKENEQGFAGWSGFPRK